MTREENQRQSIEIVRSTLQEIALKYGKFSYKQRTGKNIEGFNIYYDGNQVAELWAFVGDNIDKFHFYTNCISTSDKAEAIEINKGGSKDNIIKGQNDKVVYNYHPRFAYKWKWEAHNRDELLEEIAREVYMSSGDRLNITLGINDPIKPKHIENVDETIKVTCPTCNHIFYRSERCPECGQLIDY